MTAADFARVVDQATLLIESLYVHLPLKRAMHAVDPVRRLHLLRGRVDAVREDEFHAEMVATFKQLRDLHTVYVLPEPYRSRVTFLPFEVGEFFDGDDRRYVVTRVKPGAETPTFRPGVRITHWNGTPIRRAVERNADREAGSNAEARLAQGLAALTQRHLAVSLPPDEDWVTVTYRSAGRELHRRFDWQVFTLTLPGGVPDLLAGAAAGADLLGVDIQAERERLTRRLLFDPGAVALAERVADPAIGGAAGTAPGVDFGTVSRMPDVFEFRPVKTPSGTFGYVRVRTFVPPAGADHQDFVAEFVRVLGLVPQDGLILDVRGNGGGVIPAGERLLQTLTPRPVEPEPFAFVPSPLTRRLCGAVPGYAPWRASLDQAAATGAGYSDGFPLAAADACNDLGQQYQGPVVLVTDARCYSTTDIFAAGFQDHEVGPILGTAEATGAGGANVWSHALLRAYLPGPDSPVQPLPGGTSFTVAVRRCTRVGRNAGRVIEGLGVVPDRVHRPTENDLLKGDVDLINRAAGMLKGLPVRRVTATVELKDGVRTATAVTRNVDRLDVLLDGRPYRSLDVTQTATLIDLTQLSPTATRLELRGFHDGHLAASTRVTL